MALTDIPVLQEDYPLYDWADWQDSRDALVSGGPTAKFAKEAWNAIVDTLSEALSAAGLQWDDTYTTAEGAKITAAYGSLSAQMFNSVRHNIDHPAPLGWAWAQRPDFRGYVGRENFRGIADSGRNCDQVYPEYIAELVRKLNLLLGIMRGTAVLFAETHHLTSVICQADAVAQPSAHVESQHISISECNADAAALPATHVESQHRSSTLVSNEVLAKKATPTSAKYNAPVLIQAEIQPWQGAPVDPVPSLMSTLARVEAKSTKCAETSVRELSAAIAQIESDVLQSLPASVQGMAASSATMEVDTREGLPVEARVLVSSMAAAEADTAKVLPISAKALMATKTVVTVDLVFPRQLESHHRSGTVAYCKLDTGWYPPVWVNGGLWIRQSHSVTQNESGELVIT